MHCLSSTLCSDFPLIVLNCYTISWTELAQSGHVKSWCPSFTCSLTWRWWINFRIRSLIFGSSLFYCTFTLFLFFCHWSLTSIDFLARGSSSLLSDLLFSGALQTSSRSQQPDSLEVLPQLCGCRDLFCADLDRTKCKTEFKQYLVSITRHWRRFTYYADE